MFECIVTCKLEWNQSGIWDFKLQKFNVLLILGFVFSFSVVYIAFCKTRKTIFHVYSLVLFLFSCWVILRETFECLEISFSMIAYFTAF